MVKLLAAIEPMDTNPVQTFSTGIFRSSVQARLIAFYLKVGMVGLLNTIGLFIDGMSGFLAIGIGGTAALLVGRLIPLLRAASSSSLVRGLS